MLFVETCDRTDPAPLAQLPWELLQTIAVIQLYREERWIEPFKSKPKPYSLLVQQTLSTLIQKGEMRPSALGREVLTLPPFKNTISTQEYLTLLRFMIECGYLQKMDDGTVIVGLKAEDICNHYSFSAIFPDALEFSVLSKKGEIGKIGKLPEVGDIIPLAGKAWRVTELEPRKMRVYVEPTDQVGEALWSGKGGEVHDRVIFRMKKVLEEDLVYPYLTEESKKVLEEARALARSLDLLTAGVHSFSDYFYICPWVGTRKLKTVKKMLEVGLEKKIHPTEVDLEKFYIKMRSEIDKDTFINICQSVDWNLENPSIVLKGSEIGVEKYYAVPRDTVKIDKFDYMVPSELLCMSYMQNELDMEGGLEVLRSLCYHSIK